jgi:hypothetical protein
MAASVAAEVLVDPGERGSRGRVERHARSAARLVGAPSEESVSG